MESKNQEVKEFRSGDLVYLARSLVDGPEELLTILWTLDPEEDEPNHIPKYLTRTATHGKKVVFHCEVLPVSENGEKPALNSPR